MLSQHLLILSCSILRVLVLMMTIIQFPYWRLFCINIVLFMFLIAELIIRPWRLRSVQLFSIVSQFLLVFATGILFRPACKDFVLGLILHFPASCFFLSSDIFNAALQATLTARESSEDGFGSPAFVGFLFVIILVLFPIGLGLLFLVKKNIIPN
jgi:hypothetical protein